MDETSSEFRNNNSDTDSWVEDWTDIRDFEFDDSFFGIKLNISENGRGFSIEIFTQFWTNGIFEILIESTNKYGENVCNSSRPHRKGVRCSTFKSVDLDEIKGFLDVCLIGGAVKFSVIQNMFSQNPLHYHQIFSHIIWGRRFGRILNCFSSEYANRSNNEVIEIMGPMKKI